MSGADNLVGELNRHVAWVLLAAAAAAWIKLAWQGARETAYRGKAAGLALTRPLLDGLDRQMPYGSELMKTIRNTPYGGPTRVADEA